MSLRNKTIIILLAVIAGLTLILYITSQAVLAASFTDLENQNTRDNVQRALNTMDDALSRMSASAADYARWNDSYQFIVDRNEDYIEANLQADFFTNLDLNLMAFVNTAGETVFIRAVDLQSGVERELPLGIETHLTPGSPLLNLPDANSSVSGIISLPEGSMLVASRPITDDFAREPVRGALIFGEFLDAARIQRLSDSLRLPIIVHTTADPSLPEDFASALTALSNGETTFVKPLSANQVAGYALVSDIYGSPALLLRVDSTRDIYARGQSGINLFLVLLVTAGVIMGALSLLLLERFVLSRLTRLSADVKAISTSGNITERVAAVGDDELTSLSRDINGMLQTLEKTQVNLRESDQRLRSVINGTPLMLWSVDKDGTLTLLEGKTLEILGLKSAEAVGKPAADVFRNIPQLVDEIRRTRNGEEFTSIVEVKDYTFDTSYAPMRALDSSITGMVGVATNITERVMAEEALTEAYQDLDRQNKQLERVQELFRSTLDQVSDTVKRGAPREELTEYIEFVQTQFDRLD